MTETGYIKPAVYRGYRQVGGSNYALSLLKKRKPHNPKRKQLHGLLVI